MNKNQMLKQLPLSRQTKWGSAQPLILILYGGVSYTRGILRAHALVTSLGRQASPQTPTISTCPFTLNLPDEMQSGKEYRAYLRAL